MKNDKKRIMFISKNKSIILNDLIDNLVAEGFSVFTIVPEIPKLDTFLPDASLVVYYISSSREIDPYFMKYLNVQLLNNRIKMSLIVNRMDSNETQSYFSESVIYDVILHPFVLDDIVSRLSSHIAELRSIRDKKKHILVANSDSAYLKQIKDWLRNEYQVSIVGSGLQAIGWLQLNIADLLIYELDMPDLSPTLAEITLKRYNKTANLPIYILRKEIDQGTLLFDIRKYFS